MCGPYLQRSLAWGAQHLAGAAQSRRDQRLRARGIQPAVARAARRAWAAARGGVHQAGEVQAAEAVGAADVKRAGKLELRQLEDRGGEVTDLDRRTELVVVERHRRVAGELLVARGAVAAVDQRRTHGERVRARSEHEPLGARLPAAVVRDRVDRVALAQRTA